MFEKLGSKAVAAPFVLIVVLTCVLSLAIAPILQASPHNISLAIVNLDEGAETPVGSINVGSVLESQMSGEDSDEAQATTEAMAKLAALNSKQAATSVAKSNENAPTAQSVVSDIETTAKESTSGNKNDDENSSTNSVMADALQWESIESEEELQDQLTNNQLFGGIVIPADFTTQQLATQNNSEAKPQLTIYLNMGKNPQVASTLQNALTQNLTNAGIDANIELVNNAEVGGGIMAGLMAVQMMIMPLLIMSLVSSLILALLTWKKDVWGLRARNPWLAMLGQIALIAVLSACIAACALCVDCLAGGLTLPFGNLFLWLWLGSACIMLAFIGLADICFPLGALFAVCVFALGMGTAMLPAEMMPAFWADWVFPWAPQSHLGQGVRTIIYCSQSPNMTDIGSLLAFAAVGMAALLVAAGMSCAKRKKTC